MYHAACATSGLLYGVLFLIGVPCVYSCMFRDKMRNKYGLPDAPAPDWITHLFCEYCALCQEYRELKHRGFDPVLGKFHYHEFIFSLLFVLFLIEQEENFVFVFFNVQFLF